MADDYAGSTSTTGTVSVGGSTTGNIETGGDTDWFRITLTAGHRYQFDLQGSATGQGTLADPFLRLRDSAGNSLAFNDDNGTNLNSRITFDATSSGTYYLSTGSSNVSTGTGTYRVSAADVTPAATDDFAGDTSTSGSVSIGGSTTGNIETGGDTDWFRITLTAGRTYQFDLQGSDTSQGTLADPFLRLRDSAGTSITSDDDTGTGLNSQITYMPSTSGTYYLSTGSSNVSTGTGTYRVSATDVSPLGNQRPIVHGPSSVSYGVNHSFDFASLISATDSDGSAVGFTFSDATPGAGHLTLDGQTILGSSVTVTASQLNRVAYFTDGSAGSNQIAITATDNQNLSSTDFIMTINVTAAANHAPTVTGQASVTYNINQAFTFADLISASDPDGHIQTITFSDATPGAGFLTLDNHKITTSSVSVSAADLGRVGYSTGPSVGSNQIAISAMDDQNLPSTTFIMTISVTPEHTNTRPVLTAPSVISKSVNQQFNFSGIVLGNDLDGSVTSYTFSDETPGAGHLTLDGQPITHTSVTIAAGDLSRVGYSTGSLDGQNQISITATDNQNAASNDFIMTILVGDRASNTSHVNALVNYNDLSPGTADANEIVQLARSYVDAGVAGTVLWGGENCTGFLWAVAYQAGAPFFDQSSHLTPDGGHVVDADVRGYVVPRTDHPDVTWDDWNPVSLNSPSDWFNVVQEGDFVRVNTADSNIANHSFIVSQVSTDAAGHRHIWVIDNTGGGNPVPIREYEVNGFTEAGNISQLEQDELHPTHAFVQRIGGSVSSVADTSGIASWTVGDEQRHLEGTGSADLLELFAPSSGAGNLQAGANNGAVVLTNGGSESLLNSTHFGELAFTGSSGSDSFAVGALAGTDISDHTVFFFGEEGNDTFNASASDRHVVGYGGPDNDTLIGGSQSDQLTGDSGDDLLDGGAGADSLIAGLGNDVIFSGAGDDNASGGSGNDTILGQDGNDTIGGDDGDDSINAGNDNDVVFGGAGNDTIGGGSGDDTIVGQDGNDVIFGEDGADVANGGAGADIMLGGAGNDTFGGGADNDIVVGGDGADLLFGEDGVDNINGEAGDDGVVGGTGDDILGGGVGNDIVVGDDGNDVLFGELGNDSMNGGFGNDILIGGDGDDVLGGGAGDDDINGGFGNDTLFGENGNDILNGSAGNDILIGGGNDDTFVFQPGDGADTIGDFMAGGPEDRIWFKGTDLHSFADVQAHAATVGGNTVITYNGFFSVTLNGVTAGQLTAGDFIFT